MSFFDATLTTIALCWRIERRDGVTIGLTAHDRDLLINGLVHRAAPGMVPSAITLNEGIEIETMEVAGALSSDAIDAGDLAAGRFDGARVRVMAVDWTRPDNRVVLAQGEIGAVETQGTGFTAELRGLAARLDRPVVEETSPECRAELGDRRCRVPMAARRRMARVVAGAGEQLTIDAVPSAEDAWGGGLVRWMSGANSGLESGIIASDASVLTLREPPAFAAAAGVMIEVIEGCDKTIATCAARFNNAVNFRGEPHLPGSDLLMRYAIS